MFFEIVKKKTVKIIITIVQKTSLNLKKFDTKISCDGNVNDVNGV